MKRRFMWEVWVLYPSGEEPWFTGTAFADKGQAVTWAKWMSYIHRGSLVGGIRYELRRKLLTKYTNIRSGSTWHNYKLNRVTKREW